LGSLKGREIGRNRSRWENSIIMDLRIIGLGGADWTNLFQDMDQEQTVVNTVMNLRVLYKAGSFLTS
jgi:hypothetical protein